MSRKLSVHHFVANETTRTYGSGNRTSDLLRVNYWHDVPADTEFPRTLLRMDLFTRFYLERAKPCEFYLQVWWLDHPSGTELAIGQSGPFPVDFQRQELVRDVVFHLHLIKLQGVGRHRVELLRERKSGWQSGDLVVIAGTNFLVER